MISLKKYLDMDFSGGSGSQGGGALLAATLEAYRSALSAMGQSGARACPAVSSDLQQNLGQLTSQLGADDLGPKNVAEIEQQVETQIREWGDKSSQYFKGKTNEVKELLITMARTAQSVGERDQKYTSQFNQFTNRLHSIANLEDLTQIRVSLVQGANELKTYVDRMAQDSQASVAQLRAEISTYENKLKAAEELALRDDLTGLANRRNVEERIEWRMSHKQTFCIIILDLNQFKFVNDTYGHVAGDNLLKQFAQELRGNLRSSDIAGRWGGDEFIVVLDCDISGSGKQIERMRKWVFGEYTLQTGPSQVKAKVDAAVGVAEWKQGESIQQLVQRADAAMYREKSLLRRSN